MDYIARPRGVGEATAEALMPTVTLTPRGWSPDPARTGGDFPPQALIISEIAWVEAGKPMCIEDFYAHRNKEVDS